MYIAYDKSILKNVYLLITKYLKCYFILHILIYALKQKNNNNNNMISGSNKYFKIIGKKNCIHITFWVKYGGGLF